MKKLFFLPIVLFSLSALAQTNFTLQENDPVFVYSLPKTELCIEVEIEKTTQKPGEFYRYSERYLATTNVITEEKTTYRLKNVRVKTNAVPDATRTYSVRADKKTATKLTVNDNGLLCGINLPEGACCKTQNRYAAEQTSQAVNATNPLPLTEEYMMASSVAKMAEGAAKQIYRIRESRISLLTGDVDQFPADGESFKAMLDGMDKMEKELTELFTGSTITETQKSMIYVTPASTMNNEVLFRISNLKGLVSATDLSGSPYYINVQPESIALQPQSNKATKSSTAFYSILPAQTQITIGDGKNTFFSERINMPQFGHLVPIPEHLIMDKAPVYIDGQTGRLIGTK